MTLYALSASRAKVRPNAAECCCDVVGMLRVLTDFSPSQHREGPRFPRKYPKPRWLLPHGACLEGLRCWDLHVEEMVEQRLFALWHGWFDARR